MLTSFESLDALSGVMRAAVVDLLYRLADDDLILGCRHGEWGDAVPVPTGFDAFVTMAREEIAHADAYYDFLSQCGEPAPDVLRFSRAPRQFHCASLVCLPNDDDWTFSILRQFFHDAAEVVRLTAVSAGTLAPLAALAARIRRTESEHLIQGRRWVLQLAAVGGEQRDRLQAALQTAYPHALGLFEPTEANVPLHQAGICPHEEELRRQWESAVAPVLCAAGVRVPDTVRPVHGGRVGQHHQALTGLLRTMADRRKEHSPHPRTESMPTPQIRFHHIGIPTNTPRSGEEYNEQHKLYTSGYAQSPYGVEWLRFDPDCPMPELVKTVPHVAFVVDDLGEAIAGKHILVEPNRPADGVTVAFIVDNGAPIEFLQFDRPECEIWPHAAKFQIE